jgi:TatD DNase family protein
MPFIDSHAHIDGHKFAEDRDAVIQRALDSGVEVIVEICNGDVERGSLEEGIAIAEHYPFIYAAVGLHPHDAKLWDGEMEARLKNLARSPKVIAWGEIGLDFHYNHSEPDVQRAVFRRQLEIAGELNLPVVIHSREANSETIDILRENRHSKEKRGIFHCFSGDMEMALAAIDLGFMISFAGSLTFKKAADLRTVAKELPLDRLLIETDCPFLTPEPHRGKRNEPSYVTQVARQIGELKGISADEIGRVTTDNFYRFYGLK